MKREKIIKIIDHFASIIKEVISELLNSREKKSEERRNSQKDRAETKQH